MSAAKKLAKLEEHYQDEALALLRKKLEADIEMAETAWHATPAYAKAQGAADDLANAEASLARHRAYLEAAKHLGLDKIECKCPDDEGAGLYEYTYTLDTLYAKITEDEQAVAQARAELLEVPPSIVKTDEPFDDGSDAWHKLVELREMLAGI